MTCLSRWFILLAAWFALCSAAPKLPSVQEDTTCVTQEAEWYKAEDNMESLATWMRSISASVGQSLDCLDLFGASGRVARTWQDGGYDSTSFDIKINPGDDITCVGGFKRFIHLGLKLRTNGILVCAPPCSLMVAACQSVHQRTLANPEGNQKNFKVRLSRRIWLNMAMGLRLLLDLRPTLGVFIEQPSSSWAYKLPFMVALFASFKIFVVTSYMGLFGHDLAKCSHLASNLRPMNSLARCLKKKQREKIKRRFRQRQAKRAHKKVYWKSYKSKNGKRQWQGCKDLASTATWTWGFTLALLKAWEKSVAVCQPYNHNEIVIAADTDP